jgi:hypothetical protein
VSDPHDIPESVREYFGHDKVALFGAGGMPAAPPAPPGSPARRQGETALADALSRVGTPGPRIGDHPAARPPKPAFSRLMRSHSEQALMEHSQRVLSSRRGGPMPHAEAGWVWRAVFAPAYRALPWGIKRRMTRIASGVKGWSRAR